MSGAKALALLPLLFDCRRRNPEIAGFIERTMNGKYPSLEERLRIAEIPARRAPAAQPMQPQPMQPAPAQRSQAGG